MWSKKSLTGTLDTGGDPVRNKVMVNFNSFLNGIMVNKFFINF